MKELIDAIEQAFADVEYPSDDDLTASTQGEEPAEPVGTTAAGLLTKISTLRF